MSKLQAICLTKPALANKVAVLRTKNCHVLATIASRGAAKGQDGTGESGAKVTGTIDVFCGVAALVISLLALAVGLTLDVTKVSRPKEGEAQLSADGFIKRIGKARLVATQVFTGVAQPLAGFVEIEAEQGYEANVQEVSDTYSTELTHKIYLKLSKLREKDKFQTICQDM